MKSQPMYGTNKCLNCIYPYQVHHKFWSVVHSLVKCGNIHCAVTCCESTINSFILRSGRLPCTPEHACHHWHILQYVSLLLSGNLAVGKPAWQFNTYRDSVAGNAVDGGCWAKNIIMYPYNGLWYRRSRLVDGWPGRPSHSLQRQHTGST